MPLDTDDVRTISPAAADLAAEIASAVHVDSPGGKRITREEGGRILKLVGKLLLVLIADLID